MTRDDAGSAGRDVSAMFGRALRVEINGREIGTLTTYSFEVESPIEPPSQDKIDRLRRLRRLYRLIKMGEVRLPKYGGTV